MIQNFQIKDKHKSFLLIGIGAKKKYYMEIVKPESSDEVHEAYGECDLTVSYDILSDGHEGADIFTMNLGSMHDYLEAALLLQSYDFSYIVPVDIALSNSFVDPSSDGRRTYYLQYFIQKSLVKDDTVIFATDNHASLYEDIDAFLDDMDKKVSHFSANSSTLEMRQNIVFVANNLVDVPYANVVLARMVLNSEVNEYPYDDVKRTAIFDIDQTDTVNDMAYFKSHADGSCTIENLLNLYPGESMMKLFTVYRICCYISRDLEFEKYIGSTYVMYKKQQISSEVEEYLSQCVGRLITSFRIDEVRAEEDFYHPGTVYILVKYSIKPIGSAEQFIQRTVKA